MKMLLERFQATYAFRGNLGQELSLNQQTLRRTGNVDTTAEIDYIQVGGKMQFRKFEINVAVTTNRLVEKEADVNF
jgi:hypothetical protein